MVNLTKRYKVYLGVMAIFLLGFGAASIARPVPAQAGDFDKLLGQGVKIVGIGVLVDKFGPEINKFINNFLDNSHASLDAGSKVVPIISPLGGSKRIGACQITGPQKQVEKVGAVVQLETKTKIGTSIRLRALIPIEGADPTHIKRVAGVGVSALIDIKI